jgi:hypothetical protein
MQQLEAWFRMVDISRKTTPLPQLENRDSDSTTIFSPVAHSLESGPLRLALMNLESTNVSLEMKEWRWLWKKQHANHSPSETYGDVGTEKKATKIRDRFFKEVVPCSDVIHIIPLLSFSEKHKKINTESRPCNKHTENMMQHTNIQQSNDVTVPPITTPQLPRMLDEWYMSKLNEKKLSPSKSKVDQLVTKTHEAQEIVTKDKSRVQKKSRESELDNIVGVFYTGK